MKHFVKTSVATVVATAAVFGSALITSSAAFAGANPGGLAGSIVNTRHNLGSGGQGPNTAGANDTVEICIFCHTPHGGDTNAPVPLWNKQLTTAVFTTYDQLGTSTLDAAVGTVGSISLACLTCHDGTQAIDNIINAPGSGGYDPTGGGVGGLGWTWATDGTLDTTGRFVGTVDVVGGGNIWQLGTDLTNDHPISMQYGGGGYSSPSNLNGGAFGGLGLSGTRDMDFVPATNIAGTARWYIEKRVMNDTAEGADAVLDKWDFKLYTRDTSQETYVSENGATFTGEMEPFVECGSCHDPHFQTTTFLRMEGLTDLATRLNPGSPAGPVTGDAGNLQSNRGSRVCLTCHTK